MLCRRGYTRSSGSRSSHASSHRRQALLVRSVHGRTAATSITPRSSTPCRQRAYSSVCCVCVYVCA